EMTIAELREAAAANRKQGRSDAMQFFMIQQKFSIPVSCVVFIAIGLALGVSNRKDGAFAGFAVASAVIFVYYILLYVGRAGANGGRIDGSLGPWIAN